MYSPCFFLVGLSVSRITQNILPRDYKQSITYCDDLDPDSKMLFSTVLYAETGLKMLIKFVMFRSHVMFSLKGGLHSLSVFLVVQTDLFVFI